MKPPSSEPTHQKVTSLRDHLFLGFCAVGIIGAKLIFRWKMNINGHSMFFKIFFLLLARGCINRKHAATFTGFLVGLMALFMGLGKGGPFMIIKYLFPALVIDLFALFLPKMTRSYLLCALVALFASATKFLSSMFIDWLMGVDTVIMIQHAVIEAGGAICFGVAGSLIVPPVIRKLEAHDLI